MNCIAVLNFQLIFTAYIVQCSNILVATMPQGKSHAGSMVPLLEELIRQGHNVTIYMEQYGDAISFGGGIKQWYINVTDHPCPHNSDESFLKNMWYMDFDAKSLAKAFYFSTVSCSYVLDGYRTELMRIIEYPWDLILTDSLFTTCGYAIALTARTKHVIMHTTSVEAAHGLAKGYARQYATVPPLFMRSEYAHFEAGNFLDRLYSTYEWTAIWYMIAILENSYMKHKLAPIVPRFDFMDYNKLSSMSFTDMPSQLMLPESRTNEVNAQIINELFLYGAYCAPYGNLTGELADFVNNERSHGTILLAFGTILDWKTAPEDRREAFVQALNQLQDYRIVWSCRSCSKMKIGSHIKLLSWVPQQELLNHPRTKLFITHGGLKSVKEATCARMPTLFMPMFAEQIRNSWLAKRHGFGQIVNKVNLTADSLLNLIKEMLGNPSYTQKAEKMRRYFDDVPIPALHEGAFRIRKLIKYGGRMPEYFYTKCTNFSYIRYLNLDIVLLIPLVLQSLLIIK